MIRHFIRGLKGYACRIPSEYWHSKKLEEGKSSPGRKYLNSFLIEELPKIIRKSDIAVLDIGCGSGYFQMLLTQMGYKGSYTGLDIDKHEDFDKNASHAFDGIFVQAGIEDFETNKTFDLVFSITVLEHIENDALAICKCNRFLKPGGCQIHIIPSFWSLFLYLRHGYRQYSPKHIKILFHQKPYKAYRIGGVFSFLLHFVFITIPSLVFNTESPRDSDVYPELIETCNRLDRFLPFCSSLYVIVANKD